MLNLFIKKPIAKIVHEAEGKDAKASGKTGLKRTLGSFNLALIGIGAIVGAGIFTMTGAGAAYYAGPAIAYSFVLAGLLCLLAGLCYSEMAVMLPVSGSAYTYSYATLGEFMAWIIGWDLILEYTFGAVIVGHAWGGYFLSLLQKQFGLHLPARVLAFCRGPWETITLVDGTLVRGIWNVPGSLIVLLVGTIVYRGVRGSTFANNLMVFTKLAVILGFVFAGWSVMDPSLWKANPEALGPLQFIPLESPLLKNGREVTGYGWPGVMAGTGVVFLAYIGFDIVATSAQECRNPSRDIPRGIIGSLAVCTALYVLVSLVLTGVVPYKQLGISDPIALGIDRIVSLHGWPAGMQRLISVLVKVGALAGLTSVLITFIYGQSRIFYAMAKDGLLPWFDRLHAGHSTPHVAIAMATVAIAGGVGVLPLSLVGELVSIGTLLAFMIVCAGIPLLRKTNPNAARPFRTPWPCIVGPLGAATCVWVMSALPVDAWIRLALWLAMGVLIYFNYGIRNSKLRKAGQ